MTFNQLNNRPRPTDAVSPFPMSRIATTAEEARAASLASVREWCGYCNLEIIDGRHDCRVPAEVRRMHAEGAVTQYRALSNFTPPPCAICNKSYPAGSSHDCDYPTHDLPHDQLARAWARQGLKQLTTELTGDDQ